MTRRLAGFLVVALVANTAIDTFAQTEQVNLTVPPASATPGTIVTPGVPVPAQTIQVTTETPAPPAGRRGTKSKLVIPLPPEYQVKDKNGDGQIGLYEWERSKYAEFFKLDKNRDGFLTAAELTAKGSTTAAKIKIGSAAEKEALPNPGNLVSYNQKIGETVTFTVTGQSQGSIWGTGTYTTDSNLATVAVHAGVLKDGETGTVRVTLTASPPSFEGSASNGVTSNNWPSAFPAAFTVR